jgi:hypothetical protein
MDDEIPVVDVITDPAEIDAARKHWAEVRERRLVDLLSDPGQIHHFDEENLTILREKRVRSLDALCKLRDDEAVPAPMKIHAVVALKLLGIPPDPELLMRLGLTNDEAMLTLLHAFFDLYPTWPQKECIPDVYTAFFKDAIRSGNREIRNSAAYKASWNPALTVSEELLAVIRAQSQSELEMLGAAARRCPSREILTLLIKAQDDPDYCDKGKIIEIIATLGQSTDDLNLKQDAAKLCFDYLRTHPDERSYGPDGRYSLELIASTAPVENARNMLVELVRSSTWELLGPIARSFAIGFCKRQCRLFPSGSCR